MTTDAPALPGIAVRTEASHSNFGVLTRLRALFLAALGLAGLYALWWVGGWLIASNPRTAAFAGFAPDPALASLWDIVQSGELWTMASPSLTRVGLGLLAAMAVGIPLGILVGWSRTAQEVTNVPFQLLRMISPLSWMPIAVLAFTSWDGAIVFLITVASVWPILFATAAGVRRIDPA